MGDHTDVRQEGLVVAWSRLLKITCLQAYGSAAAYMVTDTQAEMHTSYTPHALETALATRDVRRL